MRGRFILGAHYYSRCLPSRAVLRIRASENKGINSINPHIVSFTKQAKAKVTRMNSTAHQLLNWLEVTANKNGTGNALTLTMRINIVERCQETNSSIAFGYYECIAGSFKYRIHICFWGKAAANGSAKNNIFGSTHAYNAQFINSVDATLLGRKNKIIIIIRAVCAYVCVTQ